MDHPPGANRETNIDSGEVTRFARLADEWWDPNGKFKPLHALGPARMAFVRDAIDLQFTTFPDEWRPLNGRTVLDVGCGGGLVAEPLARLGGQVTGIDPAEESIAVARTHAKRGGLEIDYRAETAQELAALGQTYDLVTCLEVVEHVPDPGGLVQTLAGLVAPGGCLILSTLNRTARSFALAIVGAEYVLGWLDRGTHDWNRFITPAELRRHVSDAGMVDYLLEGIVFNPITGTWTRSSDTAVNYMMAAHRSAQA